MNYPSRTDEPPRDSSADSTTRQDLNGKVNLRTNQDSSKNADDIRIDADGCNEFEQFPETSFPSSPLRHSKDATPSDNEYWTNPPTRHPICFQRRFFPPFRSKLAGFAQGAKEIVAKFGGFIGPGFIISVAYIDPGNYSTDVAAGAATRFHLLFIVLMSNVFAIVLQSLAIRLGTVTGMNLAEHCRAHLPKWLNFMLYILGEAAIIATDIAEVIGSAIALNLLLKIPLVAGCAITLIDVLVILVFYSPTGSMRRLRAFEYFVMTLVLGVVICFCIQLSLISSNISAGSVFAGYLPSSAVVKGQGVYLSCGILGATVMPHSLYLGSGMVQSRLREFDNAQPAPSPNNLGRTQSTNDAPASTKTYIPAENYRPSLAAINHCLKYSIAEVSIALFTFALFVNSAILIVAGASLYTIDNPVDISSLFSIHDLLSSNLAPAAGTIFALALLLSGTSAGIVCTIAGQMLSEGALNLNLKPWMRRLLTRSISITPSIIIAGAVGKDGLSAALNGTQVALSVVLPFVSAPLIYFTCRNKYMIVGGRDPPYPCPPSNSRSTATAAHTASSSETVAISHNLSNLTNIRAALSTESDLALQELEPAPPPPPSTDHSPEVTVVKMRNQIWVSVLAVAVWLVIATMNVALLVLLGLGKA